MALELMGAADMVLKGGGRILRQERVGGGGVSARRQTAAHMGGGGLAGKLREKEPSVSEVKFPSWKMELSGGPSLQSFKAVLGLVFKKRPRKEGCVKTRL